MDFRSATVGEMHGIDLVLERSQLGAEDGLYTAVLLSLFTDRRAGASDELPDDSGDRRGWFGDAFAEVDGDRFGSRLWLLEREKRTSSVAQRAREYAREALGWLIEDGIARAVEVDAAWLAGDVLALDVRIYRADGGLVAYRFADFWSASNGL